MQFLSISILLIILETTCGQRFVCYFTNWSKYRQGHAKFTPANINPYLCTHIVYAFAKVENNTLTPFDRQTDIVEGYYRAVTNLKNVNPSLQVLLSVGGYNHGSREFSPMASTAASRNTFIVSVIRLLRLYNFDGLDLDWEYPTKKGGVPADKPNYSALIREMQFEFAKEANRGPTGTRKLTLAAAVPAGINNIRGFETQQLCRHLDFLNVMTYDFHGQWDSVTGPLAPLYGKPGDRNLKFNTLEALRYWDAAGCPRDKLVMGIPLYARTWTLSNPIPTIPTWGHPGTNGAAGPFTREAGILAYYEFCKDASTAYFDPGYLIFYGIRQWNQFYNFDGPLTMQHKARFVKYHQLGGVMLWALDFDDFTGTQCGQGQYSLTMSLRNALFPPTPACTFQCPSTNGIFPDPCSTGLYVCNGPRKIKYSCPGNTQFNSSCICCN